MGQKLSTENKSKRIHDRKEEVEQEIYPESMEYVPTELSVEGMPRRASVA